MNVKQEHKPAPKWQPSISVYLILMNVILLCLLFPTISAFYFHKFSAFREEQLRIVVSDRTAALRNKAAQLSRSLSHSGTQAISEYNFTFLNELIQYAVENDPEFIGCQFVSQLSSGIESAGFGILGTEQDSYKRFLLTSKADKLIFEGQRTEGEKLPVAFVDVQVPAESGTTQALMVIAPVYVGGNYWGLINATFSMKLLNSEIDNINNEWSRQMRQIKLSFMTITLIFVFVGIFTALLITRPLLRSISLLREGVEKVSGGRLEHQIYYSGLACDEFVVLSKSFNEMTRGLKDARQQLDDYSRSLEEKVAERTKELKETQDELLAQAHEAGMAEMAVGVLHNIGNAITPVKVGTATILKQMRESPLRVSLEKALAEVPDAINSVPEFSDEEKERISSILRLLPESIREEYDKIISEIELISEKHKYIENIISLQMHYARLKGKAEKVDVNRVAGDAIEMLSEITEKQEITVETSFKADAEVLLEESKLLQILINLIKNGCEAMSESREDDKKIIISTYTETDDIDKKEMVVLSVLDNGSGFTPEEKKHFFSFGYSTKKRGSGFGLHSCANYLIANNGSIEAQSEGPGRGAEFIIRMPVAEEIT